jgi:hypothetical protein
VLATRTAVDATMTTKAPIVEDVGSAGWARTQDGGEREADDGDRPDHPRPARPSAGEECGGARGHRAAECPDDQPGAGVAPHVAEEREGRDGADDYELHREPGEQRLHGPPRGGAERTVGELERDVADGDHREDGGEAVEGVVGVGQVGTEPVPPDDPAVDPREREDGCPQDGGRGEVPGGR